MRNSGFDKEAGKFTKILGGLFGDLAGKGTPARNEAARYLSAARSVNPLTRPRGVPNPIPKGDLNLGRRRHSIFLHDLSYSGLSPASAIKTPVAPVIKPPFGSRPAGGGSGGAPTNPTRATAGDPIPEAAKVPWHQRTLITRNPRTSAGIAAGSIGLTASPLVLEAARENAKARQPLAPSSSGQNSVGGGASAVSGKAQGLGQGFDWGKAAPWIAGGSVLGLGGLAYMKHRRDREDAKSEEDAMKALYKGASAFDKRAADGKASLMLTLLKKLGQPKALTSGSSFKQLAGDPSRKQLTGNQFLYTKWPESWSNNYRSSFKDQVSDIKDRIADHYVNDPRMQEFFREATSQASKNRRDLALTAAGLSTAAGAGYLLTRGDGSTADQTAVSSPMPVSTAVSKAAPASPPPVKPAPVTPSPASPVLAKSSPPAFSPAKVNPPMAQAGLGMDAVVDQQYQRFLNGAGKIGLGVAGVGGLYALGRYLNRPKKRKEASVGAYKEAAARFPREAAILSKLAHLDAGTLKEAVARDASDPRLASAWEGLFDVLAGDLEKQAEIMAPTPPRPAATPPAAAQAPSSAPPSTAAQAPAAPAPKGWGHTLGRGLTRFGNTARGLAYTAGGTIGGLAAAPVQAYAHTLGSDADAAASDAFAGTMWRGAGSGLYDAATLGGSPSTGRSSVDSMTEQNQKMLRDSGHETGANIVGGADTVAGLAAGTAATGGLAGGAAGAGSRVLGSMGKASPGLGLISSATKAPRIAAAANTAGGAAMRAGSAIKNMTSGQALSTAIGASMIVPPIASGAGFVPKEVRVQAEVQKAHADAINRATQAEAPLVSAQAQAIRDQAQSVSAANNAQADAVKSEQKLIEERRMAEGVAAAKADPEGARKLYEGSRDAVVGVLGEAAQGKLDLKDPANLGRLQKSFGETIDRYQWMTGKDSGQLKVLFEKSMADGVLAPEEQAALQEAVSSSPAFAETVERMQGQAGQAGQAGGIGGFFGKVQDGASQAFGMAQQQWGQMPTWAKFAAGLGLPMAAIGLMSSVFGGGGAMGLLATVLGIGGVGAGLGLFGGTQGPLSGAVPQLEGIAPWIGKQLGFGAPEQAAQAPGAAAPAQPAQVAPQAAGQPAQQAQTQPGGAPPIQDLAAWSAMPGQAKIDYVKNLPQDQAMGLVQSMLATHGVDGARQMLANVPVSERQSLASKLGWYASFNGKQPWIDQAIQALS